METSRRGLGGVGSGVATLHGGFGIESSGFGGGFGPTAGLCGRFAGGSIGG